MARHVPLTRAPLRRIALALIALAAGCSTVPVREGVEIVLAPGSPVDEDVLRFAAAHEIDAFLDRGRAEADLADAADSMARRLREDGYASARIRHELVPAAEGAARAGRLLVDEGLRAVVGDVTFPGASAFPLEELRAPFVAGRGIFGSDAPLRRSRIDAAVAATLARYLASGYVDAVVGPAALHWNADRTRAGVEVPVNEGRKWTVSRVRVEAAGDASLAQQIAADLALEGKPLTRRSAAVAASRARRFLAGRGHLDAAAEATEVRDEAAATAEIGVRVTPGPVARAGAVRFEGLDRTDPDFARGLVPVREGEVLTQDQIDAATKALSETGVFGSVAVAVRPAAPGEAGGLVPTDLDAAVREIQARTVDFELGVGDYEGVRGRVRYIDRNFLGRATTFDTELSASFRGAAAGARYEDRYLIGSGVVFSAGATGLVHENPDYTESGLEFETSVRREFADRVKLTGGYRLRHTQATHVEGAIRGAETEEFELAAGPFVRIERDGTDDPFFPRRGTIAVLETFWSTPSLGADLDFLEVGAFVSHHIPLGERTVLVFAGRGRTREVLDGRRTLPIQERLFLGGEDSVRSFDQDELSPLNASGHATGGLTALELHAELRQRLSDSIDGSLFYDVGWVSPAGFDVRGEPGEAIGVGLVYRLPVGPFRLDVAWNPGALYAADRRWAVHFSFGFAF